MINFVNVPCTNGLHNIFISITMYSTAHRQLDKRVRVTRVYEVRARESISGNRVYPSTRVLSARAREGTRKYSRLDSNKPSSFVS